MNKNPLKSKFFLLLWLLASTLLITLPVFSQEIEEDTAQTQESCQRVRFLLNRDGGTTPYDLGAYDATEETTAVGGGVLQIGEQATGNFSNGQYTDVWSFAVPATGGGDQINETLEITVVPGNESLQIELALFFGMDEVATIDEGAGYKPANDDLSYRYDLNRVGIYSLVIRQATLPYSNSTGMYTINSELESNLTLPETLPELATVRDESQNRAVDPAPTIQNNTGYQRINLEATLLTHPNAVNNVSTLDNQQSRAEYGAVTGSGFFLNSNYDRVILLGGDLVITGNDPENDTSRLLYIEDFDYRTFFGDARGNPTTITTQDGTNIQLNWDQLQGVWIARDCAGFRLRDGTSFISPITTEQRTVTFRTDRNIEGDFDIRVVTPNAENRRIRYEIDLNWDAVRPGGLLTLNNGIFELPLLGNRNFQVSSTQIDIRRDPNTPRPITENTPLLVTLSDRETQLDIDWVDINTFSMIGDLVTFEFADDRGTVSRDANGLNQLRTRNGNIHSIYETSEQRLWLNEAHGFIELITPAENLPFDSLALPGEVGYISNALNNTGGECYVVNTLLPEANCPPNGHPNPANGNLWLSITDQQAYGGHLDLTLSRNYNSRLSTVDGPFGYGWTGLYRLDYNVSFDASIGARRVDTAIMREYPVSLNILWASKGLVTFNTMSGSQHTFQTPSNNAYLGGSQTLTATSMPGWILSRESAFDNWTLTLPDGLTYNFDPAGRLRWYGYNELDRITINYPFNARNGPAQLNAQPVTITDQNDSRQLELYYNEAHRIERTVLRVLNGNIATCTPEVNGLESHYIYNADGFLTDVTYPDCQTANYEYNNGVLNRHNDPRAPIAPEMIYRHDEHGFARAVIFPRDTDQPVIVWRVRTGREISNDAISNQPDSLRVSLAGDEYAERTFTYDLVANAPRNNATQAYTLVSQTGPFTDSSTFDLLPTTYLWENSLLEEEQNRTSAEARGRNSTNYNYNANGLLTGITSGFPEFNANVSDTLQNLSFGDGSTLTIVPESDNSDFTYTDRSGGTYIYTRNTRGYVTRVINTIENTAIDYDYNLYGLVTRTSHYLVDESGQPAEPEATRYTITYQYDVLGRLTIVDDSLLGTTTIAYPAPEQENDSTYTDIVITDSTDATTYLRFNYRGRLIANRLVPPLLDNDNDTLPYLYHTRYSYDYAGRLLTETQLLANIETTDDEITIEEIERTTRYDYRYGLYNYDEELLQTNRQDALNGNVVSNRPAGNDITRPPLQINGYQIITTMPDNTQFVRVYDALDRIQQVEDEFRNIERYSYIFNFEIDSTDYPQSLTNGILVEQHNYLSTNNSPVTRIQYYFDLTWQLRHVVRQPLVENSTINEQSWSFFSRRNEETGEDFEILVASDIGIASLAWQDVDNGLPLSIALNQSNPSLSPVDATIQRDIAVDDIPLQVRYDGMGRPVQLQTGTDDVYTTCYTMLDGHRSQTYVTSDLPFLPDTPLNCDEVISTHNQRTQYDSAGRILFMQDATGTRTYTYAPIVGGWNVIMTVQDAEQDTEFTWEFTYNSAGQLVRWLDDNQIERTYVYNTLGQLIHLQTSTRNTTGEPVIDDEASYRFTYNAVGAVTSITDQLRRGTRYTYNTLGSLTVIQDVSTADATIYSYDSAGLLTTVISPSGNSTNYLYEDPVYPSRVTRIIDPNGNTLDFEWNDQQNQLIYRHGEQSVTYAFDSVGALWGIRENTRDHEFAYDSAGALTAWLQSIDGENPERELQFTHASPALLTITETNTPEWTLTLESTIQNQLTGINTDDENNAQMAFDYDPLGRLNRITSSLDQSANERVWTLAYGDDAPNIILSDGFGETTILSYDALNRLVGVMDENVTESYTYEPIGSEVRLTATVNGEATDRQITFFPGLEGVGPPTITIRAPGQRITYVYNADGLIEEIRTETCLNITPETNGENAAFDCVDGDERDVWRTVETFIYDTLGRPIQYIDPENAFAIYNYDASGNLMSYQNLEGQTFNYEYDDFNNLIAVNSPTGNRLVAGYDALNNVIALCRATSQSSTECTPTADNESFIEVYTYDTIGRLIGQTFPNITGEDERFTTTITHQYEAPYGSLTTWGIDESNTVELLYSRDGLEYLTGMNFGADPGFRLSHDTIDQLNAVNLSTDERINYTYDAYDRLTQLNTTEYTLSYIYQADNTGYTIRDENSGAEIHFALNESGLLNQIAYDLDDATAEAPQVTVDFEYQFNSVNRLLVVRLLWSNGEIVEISLDRNGTTRNTFYNVQSNLAISIPDTPSGFVQQYDITGSTEFFENDTRGYIMLIGYDNDRRPLNMRITGRASGQLLYLLTFNYNDRGQRASEIRQYPGGDQVTITYQYNEAQQLAERNFSVSRVRALSEGTSPLLFVLSLLGGVLGWRFGGYSTRKRLILSAVIILIGFSGIGLINDRVTVAQQIEGFDQSISYDRAGNIETITFSSEADNTFNSIDIATTCPTRNFVYDEANRLLRVENTNGDIITSYTYDAYNRLISAGETSFIYHGTTTTLLASVTAGDDFPIIYGKTAGRAGFFRAQGQDVEWMITDGAQNTLNIQPEGQEDFESPIFVDDPLGRAVTQDWTLTDWCTEATQFSELAFTGQLDAKGIWDPTTNLYFIEGRAYSPQLGIFLQRDPLGPDVFSTVYAYPTRDSQPPIVTQEPLYTEGIYYLESAMQAIMLPDNLNASHILGQFMPTLQQTTVEPLLNHMDQTTRITQDALFRQALLPVWLERNYNLPGAFLDNEGALRLLADTAPGHGGNPQSDPLPTLSTLLYPHRSFLPQINTPLTALQSTLVFGEAQTMPYTTYQPFAWQPHTAMISDAWHINRPYTGNEAIPSEVWEWLPQTLMNPAQTAHTLRAIERTLYLPQIDGKDWLQSALNQSLPTLPELPPEDGQTWLENWFTDDIFGITSHLEQRFPHLPALEQSAYRLGENTDWLTLTYGTDPGQNQPMRWNEV